MLSSLKLSHFHRHAGLALLALWSGWMVAAFAAIAPPSEATSAVPQRVLDGLRAQLPATALGRPLALRLSGAPRQDYTLQVSTNLSGGAWTSLLITNHPDVGTFLVRDVNARAGQRFYRILIGP